MKCSTFFISFVCDHLFILFLHFKFLSYHYFNGFCFHFFLIKNSRVIIVSYCTLFFISNCNVLALITSSSLPKHSFLLALRRRGRFASVYFGLKRGFKTPGVGLLSYTVDYRFFEPSWEKKTCSNFRRLEKTRVKLQLLTCERKFNRFGSNSLTGNWKQKNECRKWRRSLQKFWVLVARERVFGTVWDTKRLFMTSSLTGGGSLRVELIKLYRSMWRPRGYGVEPFWFLTSCLADIPIIPTAGKSPPKISYRCVTEINSSYYGLSVKRTLTQGPYSVRYRGSWL